jgi:delta14-sterol reductase
MAKQTAAFEYEFGGPIGALATTLSLPFVIMLLAYWSDVGSVDLDFVSDFTSSSLPFWETVKQSTVLCPSCANTELLLKCTASIIGWFLFQVLLERFLPCELVQGPPVKGDPKNRLTYRINGHLAFWVTLLLVQLGWPVWHEESQTFQLTSFPIHYLNEYFAELAFCTIVLCFGLTTYLYVDSFVGDKILADGGDSGNPFYDFFIGRELNPRIYSFDWKEFCELRPGLIGWMLLNVACMSQQYNETGYVTGSMILLNFFQGTYVWDALYQERAILTTMDITTDGFGYMLILGDLAWVPFTYSVQARYLVKHDPHLSYAALAVILAINRFGYLIFRGSNGQKDAFRRNPNDPALAHLTFLQTKRGTKLLTSGWWGMARKINYTGDYIMGLSWCLVCGFDSIVPYYYAIYFLILLVHRSIRDDHMCQAKYGDDWQTYKKMVPYRFVPGVV